jgi:ABC-type polar amino acid transport system ATPase subunit
MVEFKNVVKRFGDRTILKGLSFRIETGEILFVLGTSGTGKSVLLKIIVSHVEGSNLAIMRKALVKSAREKSPLRDASDKLVPLNLVPMAFTSFNEAASKSAPVKLALLRLALFKITP